MSMDPNISKATTGKERVVVACEFKEDLGDVLNGEFARRVVTVVRTVSPAPEPVMPVTPPMSPTFFDDIETMPIERRLSTERSLPRANRCR